MTQLLADVDSESSIVAAAEMTTAGRARPFSPGRGFIRAALMAIVAVSFIATVMASRHTSTTFDEITMMASGARGWVTGDFSLQPEHPPLMQYLYGLPVYLATPVYPVEDAEPKDFAYRYRYARTFLWLVGNDAERIAFLARLVGALFGAALVITAFAFTARGWGAGAGLLAATLVAFLPDVLAHGGVAYNDVPLAAVLLATIWAFDAAVRRPSAPRGVLAAVLFAAALGIKFSAVAIAPMFAALLLVEAFQRRAELRPWLGRIALTAGAGAIALYLALVLIYRGDVALAEFRYGMDYTFGHVSRGHGAPGYLLGRTSATGWPYFFPVAFLFKTPAALHALILLAAAGFAIAWRRASVDAALASRLRVPLVGIAVFGTALLTSNLVIGFRYALPLLPLLCIVTSVGVVHLWRRAHTPVRAVIAALALWAVASPLSYYPYFLSYISEYGPGRGRGDEVLVDSSLDWGQGLLALRDYMREHDIDRVALSYFGSALPQGYGIRYVPLNSFFPLPTMEPPPGSGEQPSVIVISATNRRGVYLPGDPFAALRAVEPDTVLAHTLFVYRVK